MIDAPHGLTLTTIEARKPERRKIIPPTLTVERGPRSAGRSGEVLEPESSLCIFVRDTAPGVFSLVLRIGTADPREHVVIKPVEVIAEVRLYGAAELSRDEAAAFLMDVRDRLTAVGYVP